MPDERAQLAQEIAAREVAEDRANRLENDVAGLRGELSTLFDRMDKADAGIETVGKSLLAAHGKDGIKVAWPVIGLDRGTAGDGADQNAVTTGNQVPVNFINNGVLRILTVYAVENAEDFEE